ncbi:hypothetical protein WN944_005944 [Citrus x changshan-huyou]|uniref:Uncharacterized protein n=1 Tax=Citrus x changshan-huyou TaxID=2935761 RepID=A0AAP0QP87_9ROSI
MKSQLQSLQGNYFDLGISVSMVSITLPHTFGYVNLKLKAFVLLLVAYNKRLSRRSHEPANPSLQMDPTARISHPEISHLLIDLM